MILFCEGNLLVGGNCWVCVKILIYFQYKCACYYLSHPFPCFFLFCEVWAPWSLHPGLSSCLAARLPSWAYSRFIQLDVSWFLGFLDHIMGRRFSFKIHELLTFSCLLFCTLLLFPILTSTFVSLGFIYTCTDHPIGDLICSLFSC
ncbi:hypothetical protein Hanom_Chr12g01109071 [Helianthus anomalus]